MRKHLTRFLQFFVFPSLGIFIVWWLFRDLELSEMIYVLKNDTNYYWILLSVVTGILSHISRAARWQLLIKATGEKAGFNNSFWAVMTGYFVNLLIPRMGEISKCGVLSKYEKISFTKVVGTVVVERLFDMLILILLFVLALFLQFDILKSFIAGSIDTAKIEQLIYSPWLYAIVLSIIALGLIIRQNRHSIKLFRDFSSLWQKFREGFLSIRKIENIWLFWTYTIFMWIMYFLMVYVSFFSFEATSKLGVVAGITILVTGSLGMLMPVQGGLGTWHAMVISTLAFYNVDKEMAGIFALVVHGAQTLMILIMGMLAFIILPITNNKINTQSTK
ncbi:MAG: flippase-like domain-containing protein [Chlorobi bacterium]|nr:flippase-like domain-containing protein [Chlorobiota bacterium]